MLILQALINGIAIGAVYALIGIPIVLIYRASKVINFAIGGMVVWTGLLGYFFARDWPVAVAYPLLLVICVGSAMLLYLCCMRFIVGADEVVGVLVSLAIGFALEGLAAVTFGPDPVKMPRLIPFGSFDLVDQRLSVNSDAIFSVGLLVAVGLGVTWLLTRTQIGREVRAVSDDPVTSTSLGVRVDRVMITAYAVLGLCIFAAGVAVAPSQGISAFGGLTLLIGTITGVTIGGIERVEGAVVGGLVVGLLTSVGITLFDPFLQAIALAVLLIVVLLVRPQGLFTGLRGRDVA